MKTYIDFCSTMQAELTAKLKLASQLKRMWGTQVVDGVEVYNPQFTIWPGTETENVKKVLKLLNIPITNIQGQSKDGITRLYLYFNSNKMDTTSYSKEALATLLETSIPFGSEREFTLTYTDRSDPSKFIGWSKEQIQAFVESNITTVTTTGFNNTQDLDDSSIDNVIGNYIVAEAGVDFQKTLLDAAIIATPDEEIIDGYRERATKYISSIVLKYKYKRIGHLDDSSPIIVDMYDDLVNSANILDSNIRAAGIRELVHGNQSKTDTLWYDSKLRVESSRVLKKHDYTNLVFGSLDTGFDKVKKKSWAIIVAIIIVVVVTIATWGTMTAEAMAAAGALTATEALTAIAITASMVTLALTVYSMILTKYGEAGSAEYIGRWIKVTGLVAMVTGVMAAISSFMQQAARVAIEQGAETAAIGGAEAAAMNGIAVDGVVVDVSNITVDQMVEAGSRMFTSSVQNSTLLSKLSMASKVVNPIMEWRQGNQAKELTSMSDACKEQQAALVEEYDKNLHIGIEDIKMYTKPLTVGNISYEVDYLYEPTRFNICRGSFARSGMNIIS